MNKNLYVGNLSFKVTDEDLKSNFSEAGEVVSASIIKDKFTGQSKGFGFVEMKTEEGAQKPSRNSTVECLTEKQLPSMKQDRRKNSAQAAERHQQTAWSANPVSGCQFSDIARQPQRVSRAKRRGQNKHLSSDHGRGRIRCRRNHESAQCCLRLFFSGCRRHVRPFGASGGHVRLRGRCTARLADSGDGSGHVRADGRR
jgi:hypothetical protein